jgi:aminobenzoyl-glutamate utilization protein B
LIAALALAANLAAQTSGARLAAMKADAAGEVGRMHDRTQVMVDMLFSFSELGFQEFETSKYLVGILEREGFRIERGMAGIPTAWMASWGSGKPVIALGSDIDCLPQTSQKPGVAYRDPLVAGAPGHGEGHNSGLPLHITAALAVKKIMQREQLAGTLKIWPGVAEEQLAGKAHYVRAGVFKDVDIVLFTHVSSNLTVSWGEPANNSGLISVEYTFEGQSAHAGGAPWRGRSALDAVELMDAGWNYRREHLRLQQRSHYVITNGGDQPNVVPPVASVWYFFRELDAPRIKELWQIGDDMAKGAALMTATTFSSKVLGAAWPVHGNRPIAEATNANIKTVGLPAWSDSDQALAKAVQRELKVKETGLVAKLEEMRPPSSTVNMGGGSDDIGDVSWTVPTVVVRYPSNIPGPPGHSWYDTIAMATPIAHKGATAGAKVVALTVLDILLKPELVTAAWDYFRNVQTKEVKYEPLLRPQDQPAIWLNRKIMGEYRSELRKYYFDPSKYKTYMEQLGITYPTLRR